MNKTNTTVIGVGFVIVVILLVVFGGGAVIATMTGVLGNGAIGGISLIWIPVLLILTLGIVVAWSILNHKSKQFNKEE